MFKDALPETCKKCKQEDLCAAGQLYSNVRDKSDHRHIKQFTEQVLNMAMDLNDTTILEKLSTGDVKAKELFYHNKCYAYYKFLHQQKLSKKDTTPSNIYLEIKLLQEFAMNSVVNYLQNSAEDVHRLRELLRMYNDQLKALTSDRSQHLLEKYTLYESKINNFQERLQRFLPFLQVTKGKVLYVSITVSLKSTQAEPESSVIQFSFKNYFLLFMFSIS